MGLFDGLRKAQLNDAGVKLLNERRYVEASRYFCEAVKIDPNMLQPHVNLCAVHSNLGQWDLAIAEGREALRLDPTNYQAHHNLAIAYLGKGNLRKDIPTVELAVREFKVALSFKPDSNISLAYLRKAQNLWDELEREKCYRPSAAEEAEEEEEQEEEEAPAQVTAPMGTALPEELTAAEASEEIPWENYQNSWGDYQNSTVVYKEVIREIIKIPCEYCGTLNEITLRNCPSCGAPIVKYPAEKVDGDQT